jgi:2-polyprenyl-3-methyl-5-hydroxy-6-metoxy-1,4-benzoquinol methylase
MKYLRAQFERRVRFKSQSFELVTPRAYMSIDYDHYLTAHLTHIAPPATLQRNALVVLKHHGKYLPPDKNAAILEIGPGYGALIDCLRTRCGYRDVSAVDVSSEVVAACNKIAPGSTTLAEDTAAFLRERREEFDLVLMLHVLEHVPKENVTPLLEAIRHALRKNGRLVVEVPNVLHPVTGPYHRYHDFTHTVGFTDQSLAFVLRNSGFQNVTIYGCRTPRTNPARLVQRTAQDALEFFLGLVLGLYLPRLPVSLATALGACAVK